VTGWNPRRVATFDVVRFVENGVERSLSFEEFCNLPINGRVTLLLAGKPRFFQGSQQISNSQALARQD
jgi:hypothetical protein